MKRDKFWIVGAVIWLAGGCEPSGPTVESVHATLTVRASADGWALSGAQVTIGGQPAGRTDPTGRLTVSLSGPAGQMLPVVLGTEGQVGGRPVRGIDPVEKQLALPDSPDTSLAVDFAVPLVEVMLDAALACAGECQPIPYRLEGLATGPETVEISTEGTLRSLLAHASRPITLHALSPEATDARFWPVENGVLRFRPESESVKVPKAAPLPPEKTSKRVAHTHRAAKKAPARSAAESTVAPTAMVVGGSTPRGRLGSGTSLDAKAEAIDREPSDIPLVRATEEPVVRDVPPASPATLLVQCLRGWDEAYRTDRKAARLDDGCRSRLKDSSLGELHHSWRLKALLEDAELRQAWADVTDYATRLIEERPNARLDKELRYRRGQAHMKLAQCEAATRDFDTYWSVVQTNQASDEGRNVAAGGLITCGVKRAIKLREPDGPDARRARRIIAQVRASHASDELREIVRQAENELKRAFETDPAVRR